MTINKTGAALAASLACMLAVHNVNAADAPAVAAVDMATLARIRDAALRSDYSYQRLTDLADLIGPRLSGSPGAAAAVEMVSGELKKIGMQVTLQPVKVPHWVRGAETAELVEYTGRPAGITQKLVLTALGGSSATPAAGLTAPVLLVHDMDELNAHKDQAKGAIVVFDVRFNQELAQAGRAGNAYGEAGMYRFIGPAAASKLGAAAALVRSVGGADYRLTHTGMTGWSGATPIPAGALAAEDAMLIDRLAAKGPVKMHLTLTPQTLPDADSHNVLADIPGSDKGDDVVLVSGHLDSWDLAQGATDDGAGVTVAMGVANVFKSLGLKPHRTVRIVAWMNEENGGRGQKAYYDAFKDKMGKQFAAIETDAGATHPIGIMTSVAHEDLKALEPLKAMMRSLGAPVVDRHDRLGTGDLGMIEEAGGVPCFEPLLDARTYFNYHHTPADTLDKIDPLEMKRQVALLAMLTWYLAEMPQDLQRLPPGGKGFDD